MENPDASMEEMVSARRRAHIHGLIAALQKQQETGMDEKDNGTSA